MFSSPEWHFYQSHQRSHPVTHMQKKEQRRQQKISWIFFLSFHSQERHPHSHQPVHGPHQHRQLRKRQPRQKGSKQYPTQKGKGHKMIKGQATGADAHCQADPIAIGKLLSAHFSQIWPDHLVGNDPWHHTEPEPILAQAVVKFIVLRPPQILSEYTRLFKDFPSVSSVKK